MKLLKMRNSLTRSQARKFRRPQQIGLLSSLPLFYLKMEAEYSFQNVVIYYFII
jgi:hypothetical protein